MYLLYNIVIIHIQYLNRFEIFSDQNLIELEISFWAHLLSNKSKFRVIYELWPTDGAESAQLIFFQFLRIF